MVVTSGVHPPYEARKSEGIHGYRDLTGTSIEGPHTIIFCKLFSSLLNSSAPLLHSILYPHFRRFNESVVVYLFWKAFDPFGTESAPFQSWLPVGTAFILTLASFSDEAIYSPVVHFPRCFVSAFTRVHFVSATDGHRSLGPSLYPYAQPLVLL